MTAFHAAKQEQAQVVILEGEAGIGKTRLATEFLRWVTVQGADVLRGRAFETGGRLPYQPLVEALRRRVEQENAPLPGEQWPILAKLGELYKASGDEEKRRQALAQATEIIQVLAAKIDDENLKDRFCRNWIDEIRV